MDAGYEPNHHIVPGQSPGTTSRRTLRLSMAALVLAGLTGCGFHLRGMTNLPDSMQPLYVDCQSGIPFDLCKLVKTSLKRDGIELATAQDHAYTLALTRLEKDQRATAITQQATAAAYRIHMQVWSQLTAPDGLTILDSQAVQTSETYRYDENNILGKRREEEQLDRTLYGRIAQQIIFRLSPLTKSRLEALRRQHEAKAQKDKTPKDSNSNQ